MKEAETLIEIIRPIPERPGYYADRDGNIWSARNNKTGRFHRLKPPMGDNGYLTVLIPREDGVRRTARVHRLVCAAFHGLPEPGQVARHLNDIKTDNRPENLRWGTYVDNFRDAVRNNRHVPLPKSQVHPFCKYGHPRTMGSSGLWYCRDCARLRGRRKSQWFRSQGLTVMGTPFKRPKDGQ